MLGWGGALLDTDVTQVRWELFERLKALAGLQFRLQIWLLCSVLSKGCAALLAEAILTNISPLPCEGDCGEMSWASWQRLAPGAVLWACYISYTAAGFFCLLRRGQTTFSS